MLLPAAVVAGSVPGEAPVRVARELASRGYNAEREAVTLLAAADDTVAAIERAVAAAPDDALVLRAEDVRRTIGGATAGEGGSPTESTAGSGDDPPVSGGTPRRCGRSDGRNETTC